MTLQLKILDDADGLTARPMLEQASTLAKRQDPAAVTLEEYLNTSKRAARRKRKHTELKRSGVFERRRQEEEKRVQAAIAAEAARLPLHPPPSWAIGMERDGRVVRCNGLLDDAHSHDHDVSLFRLKLTARSSQDITLHWWFPPANPGSSNAWVGLFRADTVDWGQNGSPCGMAGSGRDRVLYKLITSNSVSGSLSFNKLATSLADDFYVFTLHPDYGRQCRAASERFRISNGKIVEVHEGSLSSDWPQVWYVHAPFRLFDNPPLTLPFALPPSPWPYALAHRFFAS